MLTFHFITLFPEALATYLRSSILGRAEKRGILAFNLIDLRPFGEGKRRKVDNRPSGGGAGMVLMAEPICKAVESIGKKIKEKGPPEADPPPAEKKTRIVGINKQATSDKRPTTKIILFSAKGRQFNQKLACQWAKRYDHLVLIAGRYEGVDERVRKALKADEISIGPYVLTDGDVAAMAVASAVGRLVPGVIRPESLAEESYWNELLKHKAGAAYEERMEYPHYTHPETFRFKGKSYRIPAVLKTGDHKKIAAWRRLQSGRGQESKKKRDKG